MNFKLTINNIDRHNPLNWEKIDVNALYISTHETTCMFYKACDETLFNTQIKAKNDDADIGPKVSAMGGVKGVNVVSFLPDLDAIKLIELGVVELIMKKVMQLEFEF